ncbi:MAG: peroxidase [Acidimicrobiaceae bacterium]|jgi:alkylhydroperoxidase family enzyme|nr:peroxidase [Acidimicrobiaceae bacterium]|tara:strand:+ start:34990 stop:35247 length:258 start_codon:yes stop_codon:yes gene_type:complete
MAWIETIPDDDWEPGGGQLAELYGRVVDTDHGRVDHIMAVHSLNPRSLAAHQGLYESAMAGTATLRKVEREMIALVVSLENECHY